MLNPLDSLYNATSSVISLITEPYLQSLTHLKFAICGRVDRASQRVFNKKMPVRSLSLKERTLHLITAAFLCQPWINLFYQKFIPKINRTPTSPKILKEGSHTLNIAIRKRVSFDLCTVEKRFLSCRKSKFIDSWEGLSYGRLEGEID